MTLGDIISQSRSGLLQSFLGQAHEGCHSSAQCPFALDPANDEIPKARQLKDPDFLIQSGKGMLASHPHKSSFRKLYFDTVELQAN